MEAAPPELSHEDMCAALEGVLKRVFVDFDSLQPRAALWRRKSGNLSH